MPSPTPINVLVVDDQPRNLIALKAALASADYGLVTAESGTDALARVLEDDFAAILLDIRMAGMDGFETASLIRARHRSEATPIIFLTAYDPAGAQLREGYRLGGIDYIYKPFDPHVLRSKVSFFVEMFRKTAALAQRTAELEEAVKELESFSYSVSHDLRAPLRHVNGFCRILLQDHFAEFTPDVQAHLERISVSAQRMGRLIDDLLAFARTGRQALRMQRLLPTRVARGALAELTPQQEGRSLEIVIAELPPCDADSALLRQVYVNLLSNALKFTTRRAVGHIEAGFRQTDGEVVYFVRDNGEGFDMRYADKLFGVFQRLHRAEDYEGTGIGLAIAQRIVNRHGGRIWAESALGKGTTFFFTLAQRQTPDALAVMG